MPTVSLVFSLQRDPSVKFAGMQNIVARCLRLWHTTQAWCSSGLEAGQGMELSQAHRLLADLRRPDPRIYFLDAGVSAVLGWGLFSVALIAQVPGLLRVLAFAGAAFALFRVLAFIHELAHQRKLKWFRMFWHVVGGVPLLVPLLLYLPIHHDHHDSRTYGTLRDGEYEQFTGRLCRMASCLFLVNALLPFALLIRFGVLTPLAAFIPAVRARVIPRFVHLALRMPFTAPPVPEHSRREALVYEWICAVFAIALMTAFWTGYQVEVVMWCLLLVSIGVLNTARALCATHLYNEQVVGRDLVGQLADSINIDSRHPLVWLMCPVGLQYHALHHLAPQLPYHNLQVAHRRLIDTLPPNAGYAHRSVSTLSAGWRLLADSAGR